MIVPDVNLLIYAYDTDSPLHERAKAWWTDCLSGREAVGLTHVTTFAFVRITTQRQIFARPLSLEEAFGHVRSWLERSVARVLLPDVGHVQGVTGLLQAAGGAGGNLVADAQIAALAIAHNGVVHTADHDFRRFPGLGVQFPLDG